MLDNICYFLICPLFSLSSNHVLRGHLREVVEGEPPVSVIIGLHVEIVTATPSRYLVKPLC